jgi:hypothetical protein
LEQKLQSLISTTHIESVNKIKFVIIDKPNVLKKNIKIWNKFMEYYDDNPFHSGEIIISQMKRYNKLGWRTFCLLMFNNKEIKGIGVFKTRDYFKIKYGEFLLNPFYNPDFVVAKNYREIFIKKSIEYLLKNEKLSYIILYMNKNSAYIKPLQKIYIEKKYNIKISNRFEQSIISVNRSWNDYQNSRKKEFKKINNIVNRLNKSGDWSVLRYRDNEINSNVYQKLYAIEKKSWKNQTRGSYLEDQDLVMIWNISREILKNDKNYSWEIYYLVLNNIPISYVLIIYYKDTAILLKTSYHDNYKYVSPGKFIIHESIKNLFNSGNVRKIDFLTGIPISKIWATNTEPRKKIILSKHYGIPSTIEYLTNETVLSKILSIIRKRIHRDNYY